MPATAAVTFVQSKSTTQPSGQTATKAFTSSVAAGDLIVVGVYLDPNATVCVTDSEGDTFTLVTQQTVSGSYTSAVLVAIAQSTGPELIAAHAGGGKNVYHMSLHEYSGVTAVVDASVTAQGAGSLAASGNLATTNASDLIFAWFTNGNSLQNENFISLNPAYTKREMTGTWVGTGTNQCGVGNCMASADLVTSSKVTTDATATLNLSDAWSAAVIAFKAGPSYSISGVVSGSAATVTLSGAASATTTVAAGGTYTFPGLANGSYVVTPNQTGDSFAPSSSTVTVNGANVAGINFSGQATVGTTAAYAISGTVSGSAATVTLSGPSSATATVAAGGTYTFSGLVNGSYTVTAAQGGYTFSPPSSAVTVSGANVTGINFSGQAAVGTTAAYAISGTVSGSAATVTLSGPSSATATVAAGGTYTFSGLANGLYVISASQTGYSFAPSTASVTVNGAVVTGVSFSATALPPSVSLSWLASVSANINGYKIYRSMTSGGPYSLLNSSMAAGTNYVDKAVSSGKTYYYVTTAVSSAGMESGYSNQAAAAVP